MHTHAIGGNGRRRPHPKPAAGQPNPHHARLGGLTGSPRRGRVAFWPVGRMSGFIHQDGRPESQRLRRGRRGVEQPVPGLPHDEEHRSGHPGRWGGNRLGSGGYVRGECGRCRRDGLDSRPQVERARPRRRTGRRGLCGSGLSGSGRPGSGQPRDPERHQRITNGGWQHDVRSRGAKNDPVHAAVMADFPAAGNPDHSLARTERADRAAGHAVRIIKGCRSHHRGRVN